MPNYQLNESKMFADITDGIAIIINSETGIYYGFNGFSTCVYENLINGASSEDILAKIKTLNGVTTDIEEKYNEFIQAMLSKELITEAPASFAEVNIDNEIAMADNFVLDLQEYNDAQELLLADPIHEVKEETGWTPEKDSIGYSKEQTKERETKSE